MKPKPKSQEGNKMEREIEIKINHPREYMNSTYGLMFAHPNTDQVGLIAIIICGKIEYLLCDTIFLNIINDCVDYESYISSMICEKLFNTEDNIIPSNLASFLKKVSPFMIDIKNDFKIVFKYNDQILQERINFDYSKIEDGNEGFMN